MMMTDDTPDELLPQGLDDLPPLSEAGVVSFIWTEADSLRKLYDLGVAYPDKRFHMTRQFCIPEHRVSFSYYTLSAEELQHEREEAELRAQQAARPVLGREKLVRARDWLLEAESDFGMWFNEAIVLMVREGSYFGAARPGHALPRSVYPCFDVDEALSRAGVAPDALGEGY